MSEITVTPMGEHEYGVQVREGDQTTSHRVTVPADLLDTMGVVDAADGPGEGIEEAIVRESFEFLLEREPATSILPEFSLSVISDYFPEYVDEVTTRLS